MTEGLLPEAADQASYMEARSRLDFVPAAAEICRRHGIPSAGPARVDSGTHLVFLLDGMAIKLYAPSWSEDFRAERGALAREGAGVRRGGVRGGAVRLQAGLKTR
ncbi:MAG TPA: hypothetical protein PLV86_08190 [Candidatus Fermentibacter daniensis]|nr:MAG: hypothetical protein AO396_06500 [Candidatus Fermentibacter daniensis]MBP7720188.1 hypothetical protein [Candidatus Fermentibacter sp.]KZD16433.1 MAG: hypothetical protein AO395_04585 [Candidatus Fermentibacter daniensis]KZD18275.1 MAG: hypothetical protein AO394_03580 [Candidatus Fermentibacter daniensis]NLI03514.1 hypothetical protein [Candidatus Fermentibacter daniensis]